MKNWFFILFFLPSPVWAASSPIEKSGTILRVEKGEYTHCFFRPDDEAEEMALSPDEKIDCAKYQGKTVKVTFRHEKIKVQGNYGTMDILKIISIQ